MTNEQRALKDAIRAAGGQSELARKLTISSGRPIKQQQVWNWLNREGRPSAKLAPFIEKVTGVPREKLRPDIYSDSNILGETDKPQAQEVDRG